MTYNVFSGMLNLTQPPRSPDPESGSVSRLQIRTLDLNQIDLGRGLHSVSALVILAVRHAVGRILLLVLQYF